MNRRCVLAHGATSAGLLALGACGADPPPPPPPPPPPTAVELTLTSTADANPDIAGVPKPLRVRILRLAAINTFSQVEFFTLDADPALALGQELVGADNLLLQPGASASYADELPPDVRFIGVMAAYNDIAMAEWRAWAPLPRNATTALTATFARRGITLAGAAA